MSARATPVGGKIITPAYLFLMAVAALGLAMMGWRFAAGIGATSAMSDGYPWGIWIAFDVVVGTGIACGGYAVALLCYVFNQGKYHPMVRPAILTSALGYTMAAVAIVIDVGRYWNLWKIPLRLGQWNLNSALLEVALCVMSYLVVLYLELAPAVLEKWRDGHSPGLKSFAQKLLPVLEKALPFIIALGILLPTMHQSSLGAVMVLSPKVDALWHTGWLPLLFLISVLAMGYGMVVIESHLSAKVFGRASETAILADLGKVAGWVTLLFLVLRLGTLLVSGRFGLAFRPSLLSGLFWLELFLFAAPSAMLLASEKARRTPSTQFRAAMMLVAGAALYRIDSYLVAYKPGPGWDYFPSIPEMLITLGVLSLEAVIYIAVVKKFPILAGGHEPAGRPAQPRNVAAA